MIQVPNSISDRSLHFCPGWYNLPVTIAAATDNQKSRKRARNNHNQLVLNATSVYPQIRKGSFVPMAHSLAHSPSTFAPGSVRELRCKLKATTHNNEKLLAIDDWTSKIAGETREINTTAATQIDAQTSPPHRGTRSSHAFGVGNVRTFFLRLDDARIMKRKSHSFMVRAFSARKKKARMEPTRVHVPARGTLSWGAREIPHSPQPKVYRG